MRIEESEPLYVISVVAKMIGVHAQTLRYYEREGIIRPSRSAGRIRLYSMKDIRKLQRIKTLMDDLGVNLAGVEIILKLVDKIAEMDKQIKDMEKDLRQLGGEAPAEGETVAERPKPKARVRARKQRVEQAGV